MWSRMGRKAGTDHYEESGDLPVAIARVAELVNTPDELFWHRWISNVGVDFSRQPGPEQHLRQPPEAGG